MATYPLYLIGTVIAAVYFQERLVAPLRGAGFAADSSRRGRARRQPAPEVFERTYATAQKLANECTSRLKAPAFDTFMPCDAPAIVCLSA